MSHLLLKRSQRCLIRCTEAALEAPMISKPRTARDRRFREKRRRAEVRNYHNSFYYKLGEKEWTALTRILRLDRSCSV
jgi:hypothetical protein